MNAEITDREAAQVEEHIAYEADVELWKWLESSSAGFKVMLFLPARDDLDSFDGVMKRRKGKAGQIYKCVLSEFETGRVIAQMECQFWGRNWSETNGASIALHFHGESAVNFWKDQKTRDQGDSETPGLQFRILMMEMDDQGMVVNQRKAEAFERASQATRARAQDMSHGGPKSQNAARLLKDPDFLTWLNKASIYQNQGPFDFESADALVKRRLEITSKIELDRDQAAWQNFVIDFKRPFTKWASPT